MTRSTPSTPICNPQLPPVMAKNAGVLQHFFRNAFIRRGHDLVQHQRCIVQPVLHIFASFRLGGASRTQAE